MHKRNLLILFIPAVLVLSLDQWSKWLIRTTPDLQNTTIIDGWLRFYYTQNPGMALGIEWLSTPVISTIAILATLGILIYILRGIEKANTAYLLCMGLIIGGALGNILDRIFMGYVEGYGGVLEGHVVDFIYFSLKIGDWTVFPYIFNVADIGISAAIIAMILFNKKVFGEHHVDESTTTVESESGAPASPAPE
ncbi:signal peptidase II [Balneola sp. MJW-20]|uniref:signal peptidase II n=1 Tax=Gracilimonas aurantiaca TaxID=3234185 RepID=UPI0034655780